MQLKPERCASGWADARQAPPGSANLPSIAFRTPHTHPSPLLRGAAVKSATHGTSPAHGALRSLARQHALPGVLRFGGDGRPLHDWRLLMKVTDSTLHAEGVLPVDAACA